MVKCYTCKAIIQGNWNIDPSGYQFGAYLGVNAYFAFHSPNWVYCFCPNCFQNGNFGRYIRECYQVPLGDLTLSYKEIEMIEEIQLLEMKIQKLQQTISNNYIQIKSLEDSNKKYEKIISPQYIQLIKKIDYYQNQLKTIQHQNFQQFINLFEHIQHQNYINLQQKTWQCLNNIQGRLDRIKKSYQLDVHKIQKLMQLNISFMKEELSQASHKKLFQDQEIQNSQQFFENKLKIQQFEMKNITKLMEKAQELKNTLKNLQKNIQFQKRSKQSQIKQQTFQTKKKITIYTANKQNMQLMQVRKNIQKKRSSSVENLAAT